MKFKYMITGLMLSASIIPAHAQLPVVSGLLGDSLNTAPVQLFGLAAPVLNLAGQITSPLGSTLVPVIAELPLLGPSVSPLIGTLLDLPDLGGGLIGVGVPLGSGILLNGGVSGVLGLASGLPVIGDLLLISNDIPLVGGLLDIPLL